MNNRQGTKFQEISENQEVLLISEYNDITFRICNLYLNFCSFVLSLV